MAKTIFEKLDGRFERLIEDIYKKSDKAYQSGNGGLNYGTLRSN